jgi:hypothetical protein
MKDFIEKNKENLRKIYYENYQNTDGLLFIDFRNPNNINVIFTPESQLEDFCKQTKIIEYTKAQGLLGKKYNMVGFNEGYTDIILSK